MADVLDNKYTMEVEETNPLKLKLRYMMPYSLAVIFKEDGGLAFADTTATPSSIVFANEGVQSLGLSTIDGAEGMRMIHTSQPFVEQLTEARTYEITNPNAPYEHGRTVIITVVPAAGARNPRLN